MSKKPERWCISVGLWGQRVRIMESKPGGTLYVCWRDGAGKERRRSLRHRDRDRAKKELTKIAAKVLGADPTAGPEAKVQLGALIDLFLDRSVHGRSAGYVRDLRHKLGLVREFFGESRDVTTLSPSDVEAYAEARKEGRIGPKRSQEASGVRPQTVWHDFVALTRVLNWGVGYRLPGGRRLLRENPLKGVKLKGETNPRRPVATRERYEALRGVAVEVDSSGRLALMLVLAWHTGRRINAICHLGASDVLLTPAAIREALAEVGLDERLAEGWPAALRWRAAWDKKGYEAIAPISEPVRLALVAYLRENPRSGEDWIFPSPKDPEQPFDRHLANRWLRRAEDLAEGVEHVRGLGWHGFRRAWASDRKHLPDVDVAAAGGWRDLATLKRAYQHPDPATVLAVVNGAKHAVERRRKGA